MPAPKILKDTIVKNIFKDVSSQPEPSVATSASITFYTAGRMTHLSTNTGNTFPDTGAAALIFPKIDGGNWNADQDAIWLKPIDRYAWTTLTWYSDRGTNRIRIAISSPQWIVAKDATTASWLGGSWMWLEITPADLGFSNTSFDHPHLGMSDGHLYVTAYTAMVGANQANGFVMIRIALRDLRALERKQIGFQFFFIPTPTISMLSYPPEHCRNRAYWLGHLPGGNRARLFWWDDNPSSQIFSVDFSIPGFNPGSEKDPYISNTQGNLNWLDYCQARICGAAVVDFNYIGQPREIYFAWTANKDLTFPQPYIYVLALEQDRTTNAVTVTGARRIWNRDHAWAFPALAIAGQRKLAIACAGGGGTLPSVAFVVGYLQWPVKASSQLEGWTIAQGDIGHLRWGDYIKVRDVSTQPLKACFAATGYVTKRKPNVDPDFVPGHPRGELIPFVQPHYVVFGDEED